METYMVRRSELSLFIAYFLAEGVLIGILVGLLIIWREEPTYLDWPAAIISYVTATLFFHFLLFVGTFYCVKVNGEAIEYHAFLRKTKKLHFSDIQKVKPSIGMDVKLVGRDNKTLFYVKRTDKNYGRFMMNVLAYIEQ